MAEARLAATLGVPIEHRSFSVEGRAVHVVVAGRGTPLVLIHGLNVGWGEWHLLLAELARGFQVCAIDLPGAGQSEPVDFSRVDLPQVIYETVAGVVKALQRQDVVLVAHSVGAWAALRLAAEQCPGVSALVLMNAVGLTDYVPPRFRLLRYRWVARLLAQLAFRYEPRAMRSFFEAVMTQKHDLSRELVDYYLEHVSRASHLNPAYLIHGLLAGKRMRPELVLSEQELRAIRIPVLVLHGEDDPLIPPRYIHERLSFIGTSKVRFLRDVGHVPPVEAPAQVLDHLNAFFTALGLDTT